MKLSTTLLALVALCASSIAAPAFNRADLDARGEEICCEGVGEFYVPPTEEGLTQREPVVEAPIEAPVEAPVEEREEEICCAGVGSFYVPPTEEGLSQ